MYTQYDVIVIVAVLIFTTMSLIKGGVISIVGIAKWYGAFFVALIFYPFIKQIVEEHFVDSTVANVVAVIIVYVLAVIFLALIGGVIVRAFGLFVGSIPDRIFGAMVGFLIGYIIAASAHYTIEELLKDSVPDWFKNSETLSFTKPGAEFLKDSLSGTLDSMKGDLGLDITDEEGKIDPEKVQKLKENPKLKEIFESDQVRELSKNPKIQEIAKERIQEMESSAPKISKSLNIDKVIERAAELKAQGYEPEEVKSIIEQEMQMGR